jgi:hypothetical protein
VERNVKKIVGRTARLTAGVVLCVVLLLPLHPTYAGFQPERYQIQLVLSDAALDKTGNLYVIVNSWTSRQRNLKRILPDRSIDEHFRIARLDECCTIDPAFVDTDAEGNIYILTYRDWKDDFVVAKYDSDGELIKDFAADGILEYPFRTPVDLTVSNDGVAYVLDVGIPDVVYIAPDGSEVRGFVEQYYSLQKPVKLELGLDKRIYLFDIFDRAFSPYSILQGIAAFNPDGTPIDNFGAGFGDIDSGDDTLDYASLIVDPDGTLWLLGTFADAGPYSGAYHFDRDGKRLGAVQLDYRLGDNDPAVGVTSDNESGFIIFEISDLFLNVKRYKPDGRVREKFAVEIFKTII